MTHRRLSADEAALWRRVMANVRPAPGVTLPPAPPTEVPAARPPAVAARPKAPAQGRVPPAAARQRPVPGTTLDGSWDRKLATGAVTPDASIDLHGHNLESAYQLLDHALGQAIRRGDRVLLLITGKPPRPESERPHARGRIRAAVDDWLAASRHAGAIAAVRAAHPRHGGVGALYIVLRRGATNPIY